MDTAHIRISYEHDDVDLDVVHAFLSSSYWSPGIRRAVLEKAIQRSLVVVALHQHPDGAESQIGFARIVTDGATFAYLCDVFVIDQYRGRGVSKRMMAAADQHPEISSTRLWLLATRDAHELYAQFGYSPLPNPGRFMERRSPEGLWKQPPESDE